MKVKAIKTRVLIPPQDDLLEALSASLKTIPERSILVITSKVVSIWEGRCIPKEDVPNKLDLVKQEADKWLPKELAPRGNFTHTIKDGIFMAAAGIDSSNANGYYVLWPKDAMKSAKKIREWGRRTYGIKDLGAIITDSRSQILRRGTIGVALGFDGFHPLVDYRGTKDLFGRRFVFEQLNVADTLASAALIEMGEGDECTPAVLITNASHVRFGNPKRSTKNFSTFRVTEKEDKYRPFYEHLPWRKGGSGKKKKV